MLYLIIPPIIIIIGSAILIFFLLRKASQIPFQPTAGEEKRGLGGIIKLVGNKIIQIILHFLEKITKHCRLFSLKFHNLSQRWFQSIREKRERIKAKKTLPVEVVTEKEIKKTEESEDQKSSPSKEPLQSTASRPMISQEVVRPETRDKLEEVLVERIAANPADIEAYERLGDYYSEKGNYEDALECFKQVLKLSPVHQKARMKMKRLKKKLAR